MIGIPRYQFLLILLLATGVHVLSMFNEIMGVDSLQYALIRRDMLWNHSFLKVYYLGNDYLDKPPLLFWLTSFSYWMFGFSNFAYRLMSFLVALIALFSTYKLAERLYNQRVAVMATILLATGSTCFLVPRA